MQLAHVGVAAFIVGVTMVKGYETERDVRMAPGETVTIAGYDFKFTGTREVPGPNYTAVQGVFEVRRRALPTSCCACFPEKRNYQASGQTMTEADIEAGFAGDLYVSLGEPGREQRVGRAHLPQALRQLDLGRVPDDGAGRLPRPLRPPLPPREEDGRRAVRCARHRGLARGSGTSRKRT